MKISTRLFSLALLLLTQLPLLGAAISLKAGSHQQAARTVAVHPASFLAVKDNGAQAPVGLNKASTSAQTLTLSVFPNPARGLVTVSLGQKFSGDYKLRFNNIIGREVRTVALRPEAADGGMTINLADLPAGMYFYSLTLNDKVLSTKRLVLQN